MRGPEANPSRNVVIPNVATVDEQPYSSTIEVMAAVQMLEQNAMVAVIITNIQVQIPVGEDNVRKGE